MKKQYSRYVACLMVATLQFVAVMTCFSGQSSASDSAPSPAYVRISRAFFGKALQAQVKLTAQNGSDSSSYSSPVQWVQYPPTSSAPQQQSDPELGQVLADFSDFVACAEMTSLGQSRLCFKVMGDVSNLGVNDNEMTLRGIDTITANNPSNTSAAQCSATQASPTPAASSKPAADGGPASRYKLQKATVTSNSLELEFKYTDSCGPNVQLTLTQTP
jgi:hypothetical protein